MVSFVVMLYLPFFKVLQDKMCCQNTKMASKKNVQNSAPPDLIKTYKLYNKFAICVHNFGIYC